MSGVFMRETSEERGQPTQGPWKTGREDMQSYDGASGIPFTNIYHATLHDGEHLGQPLPLTIGRAEGENNKANARIMATAPELLAALKSAIDVIRNWHDIHGMLTLSVEQRETAWNLYNGHAPEMQRINRAIAKAEGREP